MGNTSSPKGNNSSKTFVEQEIMEESVVESSESDPVLVKWKSLKRSINRLADFIDSNEFQALDYYGAFARETRLEAYSFQNFAGI